MAAGVIQRPRPLSVVKRYRKPPEAVSAYGALPADQRETHPPRSEPLTALFADPAAHGVCWITGGPRADSCRVLFRTKDGVQPVDRLGDLPALPSQAASGPLPEEWKIHGVKLVA